MYFKQSCNENNKVVISMVAFLGWLALMLGWMFSAWVHHSFFQNLAFLGIATLLFAGAVAIIWVGDAGIALIGTILTTLSWLSLTLYWLAFSWSQHHWLLNLTILGIFFMVCTSINLVFLFMRSPEHK